MTMWLGILWETFRMYTMTGQRSGAVLVYFSMWLTLFHRSMTDNQRSVAGWIGLEILSVFTVKFQGIHVADECCRSTSCKGSATPLSILRKHRLEQKQLVAFLLKAFGRTRTERHSSLEGHPLVLVLPGRRLQLLLLLVFHNVLIRSMKTINSTILKSHCLQLSFTWKLTSEWTCWPLGAPWHENQCNSQKQNRSVWAISSTILMRLFTTKRLFFPPRKNWWQTYMIPGQSLEERISLKQVFLFSFSENLFTWRHCSAIGLDWNPMRVVKAWMTAWELMDVFLSSSPHHHLYQLGIKYRS